MESTVADFWRMVWEQCANTIVMITNLSEGGKVKIVLTMLLCVQHYNVIFIILIYVPVQ